MRQGGEPQGVQVVRQGEPKPYHCNFNRLYRAGSLKPQKQPATAPFLREKANPNGRQQFQRRNMAYRRHTHSEKQHTGTHIGWLNHRFRPMAACTQDDRKSKTLPRRREGRLPKPRRLPHRMKSAGCFLNLNFVETPLPDIAQNPV